ncbi:MAG TPA: thiamine phosphate synthase [Candidatus Acidoferrales bacterium]|nr:thiamine phosphate synthase [Candidatus Acidoferrales bacterium]
MPVPFPPLYAILDPSLVTLPLGGLAKSLAETGVTLMQVRDKRSAARSVFVEVQSLVAMLAPRDVRLIVNDRPDVAALAKAAGSHVGQDDLPVEEARKLCPAPMWVGVSTHNLEQLRAADLTSADYIAVGPIFPTGTKENPDPVIGVEFVRRARQLTRKPLVAIGGITVERAAEVYRAGADSLAVISDLLAAPDSASRAREYLKIAADVRASAG